jgi:phosphoglycerate dehydrogenase-like enzyme
MNVLVGAAHHAELTAALRAARPDLAYRSTVHTDVTADDLAWADTYVGFRRPPLPSMGNVQWVHCTGAGVDSWLYPVELPRDILLTRTSEPFGLAIAEWALARALAFTQNILGLAEAQRRREWNPRYSTPIRGTTAVLVGTGDLGTRIGRLFRAVGCDVLGVSRTGRGDTDVFSHVANVSALADMAGKADWLILTLPLTSETRGLVGRDVLRACKAGAILINCGRGAVVDQSVIVEALDNDWITGAALDVFDVEPLPADSPLWSDPRIMISPHCSGLNTIAGEVNGFLECLSEIERGARPTRAVDRDRQY